jgi:hypothetical protein
MAWGDKKRANIRNVVEGGGKLKGRDAKKGAQRGGVDDNGVVRDPRGKKIGDFSNRTRKQFNEHGG